MRLLHEIAVFRTVKSKVIISLFETVRLSVSISLRNLYNSLNSIKEKWLFYCLMVDTYRSYQGIHSKVIDKSQFIIHGSFNYKTFGMLKVNGYTFNFSPLLYRSQLCLKQQTLPFKMELWKSFVLMGSQKEI